MFNLYIDTREKKPLEFDLEHYSYIDSIQRTKLPYGDYACKIGGQRCPVIFERKSISDLFGTLGKGHKRFKREIQRAEDDNMQLFIIIEKPLETVERGYKRSRLPGGVVYRQLMTYCACRDIPFYGCKDRNSMTKFIAEYFYAWSKDYLSRNKI